jgi:putative SOS response-associated peptidase YedK
MIIIGQISGKEILERQFEIAFSDKQQFQQDYFIERTAKAWAVSSQNNRSFLQFHYGMIPFWSRNPVMHFESPVEGSINPGAERMNKRIIIHPSYRRPIRESRCLIPADYFIVPNEEGEPWLMFSATSKSFALAGIYDNWKENYHQEEFYQGFSLLTAPSGEEFRSVGIIRLPLLMSERVYKRWLNPETPLAEITRLLELTGAKYLNAYPVSRTLFRDKHNGNELCKPTGALLREPPQDINKLAAFIHSFRFKRGVAHIPKQQEQRTWWGS